MARKTHHKHSSTKGYRRLLDGLAKNVHGAVPNPAQPLSNFNFRNFWLA